MSELKTLVNELGIALRESEAAEKAADAVAKDYETRRAEYLRRFEDENHEVVARKKNADLAADDARERAHKLRKQLEESTRQWGIDHPNEPKPEVGVELRQFKEIDEDTYSNQVTIEACLRHFPYLLQINVKAMERFIGDNTDIEAGKVVWRNPSIAHFLPITPKLVRRPYLSNDKIKAAAAVSSPGESLYSDLDLDDDDERYLGASTLRKLKAAEIQTDALIDPNDVLARVQAQSEKREPETIL